MDPIVTTKNHESKDSSISFSFAKDWKLFIDTKLLRRLFGHIYCCFKQPKHLEQTIPKLKSHLPSQNWWPIKSLAGLFMKNRSQFKNVDKPKIHLKCKAIFVVQIILLLSYSIYVISAILILYCSLLYTIIHCRVRGFVHKQYVYELYEMRISPSSDSALVHFKFISICNFLLGVLRNSHRD